MTSKKLILIGVSIWLFAFIMQVGFVRSNLDRDWPFSIFYYGDSTHYHRYALHILEGKLYDRGIPYHPPMYAWFLAGLYKLFGKPTTSGFIYKIIMNILLASTTLLSWLWWRQLLGEWVALAGSIILALNFGWLVFGSTFNNEALYILWLTLTIGWLITIKKSLKWWEALIFGLIMGAGMLTRAEHLMLWPFFIVYLFLSQRTNRMPWKKIALFIGLALLSNLLLILPWEVSVARHIQTYNKETSHLEPLPVWVPITSYGPVNFALANSDTADGGFRPDLLTQLGAEGQIHLDNPSQRYVYIHGYTIGLKWLWQHPVPALRLMAKKLNRWLNGFRLGFGISNWPGGLDGVRYPVDIFIPWKTGLKWFLTILLLAGIALSFRKENRGFLICTFIVLHRLIITLLLFVYSRGLIVILPAVVPLLLLPVLYLIKKIPRLERPFAYSVFIFAGIFLIQMLFVLSKPPRNYMASGSIDPYTGKIIQDDTVRLWPKLQK